jgi:Fic family protein
VTAMNYGLDRLRELPLSVRLIKEIHERLLQGVRGARIAPGELRRSQSIISVSHKATETARRILTLREDHRAAITTHLGRAAGNGHRVLESLYKRPIVSVAEILALTGTTFTAANSLVSRLANLDILQEATGYKRNRVFRYQPYIAIFGEKEPETPGEAQGAQPRLRD